MPRASASNMTENSRAWSGSCPDGILRLPLPTASTTCASVSPQAASFARSTVTTTSRSSPPISSTDATPATVESRPDSRSSA